MFPCQRFTCSLATTRARLGARLARYAVPVRLLHSRLHAGLSRRTPTSVQFKSEINDALPRKRHQKQHLEFCTAYLRSRGSGVRVPPGAPFSLNPIQSKGVTEIILHPGFTPVICFFARWLGR